MLRSSPSSRGNSNVRSRPSTPAGASRNIDSNNNDNKEEVEYDSKSGDNKINYNQSHDTSSPERSWTQPSHSDGLIPKGYSMAVLHESRDEMEDEEFHNQHGHHHQPFSSSTRAIPGRATRQRRRRKRASHNNNNSNSIWSNFLLFLFEGKLGKSTWQLLFHNTTTVMKENKLSGSNLSTLVVAVALWYSLGIISISTSKLLLSAPSDPMGDQSAYYLHIGGVAPIILTFQQLLLGSLFLRFLLSIRCLQSPGVQPLTSLCDTSSSPSLPSNSSIFQTYLQMLQHPDARYLCFAGFCFSLGFYCTNLGFQAASAAFVETIKASEPITSAVLAVAWGLELLNRKEVTSLALIVCGVVLSTLGNSPSSTTTDENNEDGGLGMTASLVSCAIVMISNLCFSFRGLFQKLFQKKSNQSFLMDDLNLQYRMQQMGVLVFGIPAILWEGRSILQHIYQVSLHVGLMQSGVLVHYVGLATVNAMAFASYNLASTYLLSRISVVQHAALNCIRRIFAIVITSILFANHITRTGVLGILISFGGFMSFTHAKAQKKRGVSTSLLPMTKSHA
ncbi:unnamed protein product [Cylindrotheca closterium]|uniref:Sugar phosphate transporter domain-containing protein n=1 Tax=Cylindrotheca closterium TaxID=2856 RepID=A0AAD2CF53_9STRA|nr:unnamed protein product [Cylindrotheca closterium]